MARGTKGHRFTALLTDSDIERLVQRRRAGEPIAALAREFEVHPGTLSRLLRGKSFGGIGRVDFGDPDAYHYRPVTPLPGQVSFLEDREPPMTLIEYARLVDEMLKKQAEYFAARRKGIEATGLLEASKMQEKKVKEATRDILGGQPSLFE